MKEWRGLGELSIIRTEELSGTQRGRRVQRSIVGIKYKTDFRGNVKKKKKRRRRKR